jgi:hypothetical protein
MPLGIGTGIGMSIVIVSCIAGARDVGRFPFELSGFIAGIEPIPGMPGMVPGFVGGLGGV